MKKIFKVLLAFVLIAGLAVGAYFIFSSRDNSKLVHQNVYDLTFNIKDDEQNIVTKINSDIQEMCTLINANNLQLNDEYNNFQIYSTLYNNYNVVGQHILSNGGFVTNHNNDQYIAKASQSYNKIVSIYKQSYDYLKGTYYLISDKTAYIETVKSYISNFYNIFADLIPEFNDFYYNTCLAYAYGLDSTIQLNNFYKLRVGFFAETVNKYYTSKSNRTQLLTQATTMRYTLNNSYTNKYFNNKAIYDELMNKVTDIDVSTLAEKIALGKESEWLNSLETEQERILVQKYIDNVIRG